MAKITVSCKLPQGLSIHLGGGKMLKLNGSNSLLSPLSALSVVGGFGTTEVEEADYAQFLKMVGSNYAPVVNGYIFANAKADNAKVLGEEREADLTAFAPINPKEPTRDKSIAPLTKDKK